MTAERRLEGVGDVGAAARDRTRAIAVAGEDESEVAWLRRHGAANQARTSSLGWTPTSSVGATC